MNFIIGFGIGYVIGLLLLIFFEKEIFNFIDVCVYKVRGFFGLHPWDRYK